MAPTEINPAQAAAIASAAYLWNTSLTVSTHYKTGELVVDPGLPGGRVYYISTSGTIKDYRGQPLPDQQQPLRKSFTRRLAWFLGLAIGSASSIYGSWLIPTHGDETHLLAAGLLCYLGGILLFVRLVQLYYAPMRHSAPVAPSPALEYSYSELEKPETPT